MVDDGDFPNAAAAAHDAAWTTLEHSADKVMDRSRRYGLSEACVRLGVDPEHVRELAAQIREEDDD